MAGVFLTYARGSICDDPDFIDDMRRRVRWEFVVPEKTKAAATSRRSVERPATAITRWSPSARGGDDVAHTQAGPRARATLALVPRGSFVERHGREERRVDVPRAAAPIARLIGNSSELAREPGVGLTPGRRERRVDSQGRRKEGDGDRKPHE